MAKKKTAKTEDATPSRKDLVEAAKDMNKTMGLDPIIDVKLGVSKLTAAIKTNAELVEETDELQNETWKVLASLGVGPKAKPAETKPEEAPAPAPKAKGKGKKAATPKAEKAPKVERYTRAMAFADAIRSGANTKEKIVEKASALYIKSGGADIPRESNWMARIGLQVLDAFGLVEKDGNKYNFNIPA